MKNISMYQWKLWLVWSVFLAYFGLQISCTPEISFDRNVEVNLQIPIPGNGGLKSAFATTGVKSVILTVTTGDEVLVKEELAISGNTASGTISILPGKNRKFTAEAIDENNIIQWQGSTTIDIIDNFTVGIELTSIGPSATNLEALQEGKTVILSWSQNLDLDFAKYEVYRSQEESELGEIIQSSAVNTETEFTDSLISEGSIYYYTLLVVDTEGFNTKSNVARVKVPIEPPTASILKIVSISSKVELSWTQNTGLNFKEYELYRSESENDLGEIIYSTTVITETENSDSLITEGSIYYYTLLVLDTQGANAKSNVVKAEIPFDSPSASILSVISNSNNKVKLSWTQNTDPNFAKYELYRSQTENLLGTSIYSTTVVSNLVFEDSQVLEGKTYFYRLVVTDTNALDTNSNVVQVDIALVPPTASVLKGVVDGSVYLDWTQNTDSDFAKYELYRSTDKNEIGTKLLSTAIKTNIKFTDSSVSAGNTYYYTLVVFDSGGLSTKSNVVRADISNIPPSENILQVISSSNSMVELSWTQNTDQDFARYDLYRSLSESVLGAIIHSTTVITETGFKDNSISEGKSYFYTLVKLNTEGSNKKSNVVRADIPFIPPTASILQVISLGSSKVSLSWTQNTDQDFARYELYRSQVGNVLGTIIHSTTVINNTEFEDNTISQNNSYFYTLVVFDTDESNSESNVVRADIPNIPPSASILQVISTSSNMVKLSWTQNTDQDFARYDLYRSQEENVLGTRIHTTNINNNTGFEDNTVSPNTIYLYTLVVFDTKELSTKSNVVQVDVPRVPPTASILQLNSVSSSIVELSWTKNTDQDFAGYDLHRSESENELGPIIYSTTDVAKLDYGDSQITDGSIYFYTLVVTDIKELNTKSNVVQTEIPNYPPTASTLYGDYYEEYNDTVYIGNVYLSWTQNYDIDFYEYILYRSEDESKLGSIIYVTTDSTVLDFDDYDVQYNIYYYTLVVADKGGLTTESTITVYAGSE